MVKRLVMRRLLMMGGHLRVMRRHLLVVGLLVMSLRRPHVRILGVGLILLLGHGRHGSWVGGRVCTRGHLLIAGRRVIVAWLDFSASVRELGLVGRES